MPEQPRDWSPNEIGVGLQAAFEHEITADEVRGFAVVSGDFNPLHLDSSYAATTRFARCIVHGTYQVALSSQMLGMRLPGRRVLLTGIDARFPKALYYPATIKVLGEIIAWNSEQLAGRMRTKIVAKASGETTAEIHLSFVLLSPREEQVQTAPPLRESAGHQAPLVVVTGASGGLGSAIVERLRTEYRVIAQSRRTPGPKCPGVEAIQFDLDEPGWQGRLDQAVHGRSLYALVHSAWPGMPAGSLLDVDPGSLEQQVKAGTLTLVELARYLRDRATKGGRFVALGSIASRQPMLSSAGYSLGKSGLETTIKLLAPELARSGILANTVSPGFVAVGMNRSASPRQLLQQAAGVPLGRTCDAGEVASTVHFLLSEAASFIAGQNVVLSGGAL